MAHARGERGGGGGGGGGEGERCSCSLGKPRQLRRGPAQGQASSANVVSSTLLFRKSVRLQDWQGRAKGHLMLVCCVCLLVRVRNGLATWAEGTALRGAQRCVEPEQQATPSALGNWQTSSRQQAAHTRFRADSQSSRGTQSTLQAGQAGGQAGSPQNYAGSWLPGSSFPPNTAAASCACLQSSNKAVRQPGKAHSSCRRRQGRGCCRLTCRA